MKLLILILICAITTAYKISNLKVPLYADPRRAAELSCHFQMDDEKLHSVKWYREMNEIFRYTPGQEPDIRLFNISGIVVQGGECQVDSCMVRVMPHPVATRAGYTCEVSTEGPKFEIVRETKQMTVVAMPDKDPIIVGAPETVKPGEQILLNCTSALSLPPAEINWYVDGELQKPEPWQRTELGPPRDGGLRASWRVLRYTMPTTASGSLRIRCESILVVEPPVERETTSIITVFSHTENSKFVSTKGISEGHSKSGTRVTIWTLIIILMCLSL
ncbi:uncharacterized protein [Epargyreus clarus]|uniref:uncharacterized protein n=1 Tax=Epargyreus clarus TaxID=520877 RepID=UPI003C2DDA84